MQASTYGSPAELAATTLRGSNIVDAHVDAMDGRLILRGLAGSYETKRLAGERVRSAAPGMTIVNELRVAQSPSDDRRLARSVARAIDFPRSAAANGPPRKKLSRTATSNALPFCC